MSETFVTPLRGFTYDGRDDIELGPFRIVKRKPPEHPAEVGVWGDWPEVFPEIAGLAPAAQDDLIPWLRDGAFYRKLSAADYDVQFSSEDSDGEKAQANFEQLLDILRLTKFGGVTLNPRVLGRQMTQLHTDRPGGLTAIEIPAHWIPEYSVDEEGLEHIRDRFDNLYPFGADHYGEALRRFRLAHDRADVVESFVDLLICLEAIFTDDDAVDTRYKLAVRAAHVMGMRPGADAEVYYDRLTAAYKRRNAVLHGRANAEKWVLENYGDIWEIAARSLYLQIRMGKTTERLANGKIWDNILLWARFKHDVNVDETVDSAPSLD